MCGKKDNFGARRAVHTQPCTWPSQTCFVSLLGFVSFSVAGAVGQREHILGCKSFLHALSHKNPSHERTKRFYMRHVTLNRPAPDSHSHDARLSDSFPRFKLCTLRTPLNQEAITANGWGLACVQRKAPATHAVLSTRAPCRPAGQRCRASRLAPGSK